MGESGGEADLQMKGSLLKHLHDVLLILLLLLLFILFIIIIIIIIIIVLSIYICSHLVSWAKSVH